MSPSETVLQVALSTTEAGARTTSKQNPSRSSESPLLDKKLAEVDCSKLNLTPRPIIQILSDAKQTTEVAKDFSGTVGEVCQAQEDLRYASKLLIKGARQSRLPSSTVELIPNERGEITKRTYKNEEVVVAKIQGMTFEIPIKNAPESVVTDLRNYKETVQISEATTKWLLQQTKTIHAISEVAIIEKVDDSGSLTALSVENGKQVVTAMFDEMQTTMPVPADEIPAKIPRTTQAKRVRSPKGAGPINSRLRSFLPSVEKRLPERHLPQVVEATAQPLQISLSTFQEMQPTLDELGKISRENRQDPRITQSLALVAHELEKDPTIPIRGNKISIDVVQGSPTGSVLYSAKWKPSEWARRNVSKHIPNLSPACAISGEINSKRAEEGRVGRYQVLFNNCDNLKVRGRKFRAEPKTSSQVKE